MVPTFENKKILAFVIFNPKRGCFRKSLRKYYVQVYFKGKSNAYTLKYLSKKPHKKKYNKLKESHKWLA
jgi:hypothetical protein